MVNGRCLTVSCVESPHYLVEFPGVFSLDHTHSFPNLLPFAFIARRWAPTSEHIWGNACNKHQELPLKIRTVKIFEPTLDSLSGVVARAFVEHAVDLVAHEHFVLELDVGSELVGQTVETNTGKDSTRLLGWRGASPWRGAWWVGPGRPWCLSSILWRNNAVPWKGLLLGPRALPPGWDPPHQRFESGVGWCS